jgi:hypothetical protein
LFGVRTVFIQQPFDEFLGLQYERNDRNMPSCGFTKKDAASTHLRRDVQLTSDVFVLQEGKGPC